jgi:hypothetical protein
LLIRMAEKWRELAEKLETNGEDENGK